MAKKEITPATSTIACYYKGKIGKHCKNGSRELWNARHPDYPDVVGAGNSAHNAAKDFRVQLRWHEKNKQDPHFRKFPTSPPLTISQRAALDAVEEACNCLIDAVDQVIPRIGV